ncbi:MAG: hypothetical protein ACFFAO_22000 [Candidatus Hermodarchaeota archaeon]
MVENLDKSLMLNIFNSNEFKAWLISRRWFGDKSTLSNLDFEISFLYFEIIADRIFLSVIQIETEDFKKAYFLPLIYYKKLKNFLEPSEEKRENIVKLTENTFTKKIVFENLDSVFTLNLVEAEYCAFFWKKMLFEQDITEKFPSLSLELTLYTEQFEDKINMNKVQNLIEASLYPDRYDIVLEQLGKGNTTNLLFKLNLLNKKFPDKEPLTYVLKSYKEYVESLEPKTLYILVRNTYPNAPKIYGTIKVQQKESIGILENVPNIGNVGDIYWNELNNMINSVFTDTRKDYSTIDKKEEYSRLIKEHCVESLKISSEISAQVKELHKSLISEENNDYKSESVESNEYLNKYDTKLNNMITEIQSMMNKRSKDAYYNLPKFSSILIDLKDIIERLHSQYTENKISIQPVHQDLHMEQILYDKINNDYSFYFIDFEGDPQLTLEEKQDKFPIEKDLASFLRALSYIKFNTLISFIEKKIIRRDRYEVPQEILYNIFFRKAARPMNKTLEVVLNILNAWEFKLMAKMLKSPNVHIPLITYFYLERALHELNYEILFRPNNVIVPILGLKEIVDRN